jgi:GntR family transcriptional regulator
MVQMIVNPSDELPIYRQIMRQITEAIAMGRLKSGAKLPSHRELSETLVVAPLTVKKAYDELEALRYIETQRGRGTFVCDRQPQLGGSDQMELIHQAVHQLLLQAHIAGLKLPDILSLLKEASHEFHRAQQEEKK